MANTLGIQTKPIIHLTPPPPEQTFKDYRAATNNKYVHLHNCARAYITYVLLPEKKIKHQQDRAKSYKKETKGKFKFWIRYTLRELQHQRQIEAKQQHRLNKISSRTRNIDQKDRKNLSELLWANQRRVTADTKYEGLHRWPHRDKIGRQLKNYINNIMTNTWPTKPKRKRGITLTPEDNTQGTIHHTQEENLTPPADPDHTPASTPILTPPRKKQKPPTNNRKTPRTDSSTHDKPPTKKSRMLSELSEDTTYALPKKPATLHRQLRRHNHPITTTDNIQQKTSTPDNTNNKTPPPRRHKNTKTTARMLQELAEDRVDAMTLHPSKRQKTSHTHTPTPCIQIHGENKEQKKPEKKQKQYNKIQIKTKNNKIPLKTNKKRGGKERVVGFGKSRSRGVEKGGKAREVVRKKSSRLSSCLNGDGREGGSGDG